MCTFCFAWSKMTHCCGVCTRVSACAMHAGIGTSTCLTPSKSINTINESEHNSTFGPNSIQSKEDFFFCIEQQHLKCLSKIQTSFWQDLINIRPIWKLFSVKTGFLCHITIMWFMAESVYGGLSVISRFQSKVSVPLNFAAFFKWLRHYLISREESMVFLCHALPHSFTHTVYEIKEKNGVALCLSQ